MSVRLPASLRLTVPLILLAFAATLSAVNVLHHVPQAERAAEEESRKRLVQDMSRLQSTLEYQLLKGDLQSAQHEIAVLAHNHEYVLAALTDDRQTVIASTRRAWLGRPIAEVSPHFDLNEAARAIREHRAGVALDHERTALLAYAGVLMGREPDQLRPSRTGNLFLAYDLVRPRADARARLLQYSLYWAGWVVALALGLWLAFHFLLTRRTARVVRAAEQLAAGDLTARSGLRGPDELGRLSRAFDAMAVQLADAQKRRESLYQREKLVALGSLLAGVAHELNNPLSVVVARAVLLEEQGDPATRAAALKVRTAAERCARIVRTFLAMARQQQAERGPVSINDVITAALDIAAYAIRTSSIEVSLALAQDLPLIAGDADQLHQVLLNLIINAEQALQDQPAPRRLRISSRWDDASATVQIGIEDNGPGIPEAVRARIFEPYFTTKPMGSGLGVGLAVSAGIVEAHGGSLTANCPASGGAVFTIALPVGCIEAVGTDCEAPAESAAGRRILIVDDEAEIRDTLADILAAADHRVVSVGSGREALKRMAAQPFDVILADIRMPDLDGRALYREIARRWPERVQRMVFVTGDTLGSSLREFAAETGRPVIEKPFLPADVRRIVAEVTVKSAGASALSR